MHTIDLTNRKFFTASIKGVGKKVRRIPVKVDNWESFPLGTRVIVIKTDDATQGKTYDPKKQQNQMNVDTEGNSDKENKEPEKP